MRIEIKNLTANRIPPHVFLRKTAGEALKKLGQGINGELNLVFVTDRMIRKLNLKYRRKDSPTDVLAFSMTEPSRIKARRRLYGDIVISVDTAKDAARKFGSSTKKEICLYIIHGILHLLGFDDTGKHESKLMRETQQNLLEAVWNSRT